MELPAELKPDLHRTLLGPLSFATELFGALLPGCTFLILLCVKRGWITPILLYPLIGYKTKVVIGLLAGYVTGKVGLSVIDLVKEVVGWAKRIFRKKSSDTKPANQTQLQQIAAAASKLLEYESLQTLVAGFFSGPLFSNQSQMFDHYSANEASAAFHGCMGLVLLTCSLIPGDGNFRVLELAAGLIFLASAIKLRRDSEKLVMGYLGLVLNNYLANLKPEQLSSGLKKLWSVILILSRTPSKSPVGTPAPAQTSAPPPATQGETPVAPSN